MALSDMEGSDGIYNQIMMIIMTMMMVIIGSFSNDNGDVNENVINLHI